MTSKLNPSSMIHRTIFTVHSCSIVWKLDNFSMCPSDLKERYRSCSFFSATDPSTKWYLTFYPSFKKKGYDGIYLNLEDEDNGTYYAKFRLSIFENNEIEYLGYDTAILFKEDVRDWGWSDFVERKALEEAISNYDTLIIVCKLKYSIPQNAKCLVEYSVPINDRTVHKAVSQDLQQLYEDGIGTDFTLSAGGKDFKVHQAVLMARSPVFKKMLTHEMKEKEARRVVAEGMSSETAELFIRHLYGGVGDINAEHALTLYSTADRYDVKDLKDIYKEVLTYQLSVENVLRVLCLADLHGDEDLLNVGKSYFYRNASRALERGTDLWLDISARNPELALSLIQGALNIETPKCEEEE